jgi:MFS family permease
MSGDAPARGQDPAAALPATAVDGDGRLLEDVSCRRCGYNLRGLEASGPCPECTTPIGRSLHGDLLCFSDPDWVEALARGARIYVFAIVAGFVLGAILGGAIGAIIAISGTVPVLAIIAIVVVVLFVTGLQIWAYWMITTPDPGRDESLQPITMRAVARYGLILSTVFGFAGTLLEPQVTSMVFGESSTLPGSLGFRTVVFVASGATAILSLIAMYALFEYARSLADRIPDDRLARHTRIVMWGYLIPTAIVQATAFVSAAMYPGGQGQTTGEIVLLAIMGIAALPAMVFSVWGIVLVFWYRRRFFREAASAREMWAQPV